MSTFKSYFLPIRGKQSATDNTVILVLFPQAPVTENKEAVRESIREELSYKAHTQNHLGSRN